MNIYLVCVKHRNIAQESNLDKVKILQKAYYRLGKFNKKCLKFCEFKNIQVVLFKIRKLVATSDYTILYQTHGILMN